MTTEDERAALRLQMIADAEADLTKDIDPRDPDADYMRGVAKTLAVDLVDAVLAEIPREAALRRQHHVSPITPADWKGILDDRLAELQGAEFLVDDGNVVATTLNPVTKRIETVVFQRMPDLNVGKGGGQ